ncbi:MAG: MarR family winged helix-turn-helix transcriptional regulator [Christensenellales bacterium]
MSDLQGIKDVVGLIARLEVLCEGFDELNKTAVITSKVKVLLEVSNQKDVSPNKLKTKVGLAKSNLTLLCNSLVKDGLITKNKDEFDNRAIYYNITEKGKNYLNVILNKMKKNFEGELAYKNNIKQVDVAVKNLNELVK